MRTIGFALIAIGVCIALLWPWAQLNFLGNKIAYLRFDEVSNGQIWQRVVELEKTSNPVRIRFQASYKVDASLPPLRFPVKVIISDAQGTLLSGILSFPTQGITAGPEQQPVRGSQPLEFNVLNDGSHAIVVSPAPNPNDGGILKPAIGSISASVVGNAPPVNDDHLALGAIVAMCGLYLIVRYRRRKSKDQSGPQMWGRGK